jgi:TolB protein
MSSFIKAINRALGPFRVAGVSSLFLVFIGGVAVIPKSIGAADVVITSEQKGAETIPLGMVDWTLTAGNSKDLSYVPGAVLFDDLNFSGRFKVRNIPQFDDAAREQFKADGALAYLVGEHAYEGGQFRFSARLLDIETDEEILAKKYSGPLQSCRASVHKFADEMVYQLFGERGIAQTRIAYVHKTSQGKEVLAMDYDGFGVSEVSKNGSINLTPIFLGSKSKILFTSFLKGPPQFYLTDLDKTKTYQVYTSGGMNTSPGYNKMDKEVVYASSRDGNSEIYRRPIDGGKPTRLTFHGGIDTSPTWSPNGYEIAFISDRSGNPMVYIMDREGANVRRITYEGKYAGSPSWSPKGDRIVFSALEGGRDMDIWTISPDGNAAVRLTSGAGSNENPVWSPDGRFLAFMSTRNGVPEIYIMGADGSNPRRISFSGGNAMPYWSDY